MIRAVALMLFLASCGGQQTEVSEQDIRNRAAALEKTADADVNKVIAGLNTEGTENGAAGGEESGK